MGHSLTSCSAPGFSFNLLALLFLAHGMPRARDHTSKYFNLSYYNPATGNYGLGRSDGYLILFCIVLFTGLRAAAMEYVLAPFAKAQGIAKRKDITRFSEQAWLLVYYSFFWPLGVVCCALPRDTATLGSAPVPLIARPVHLPPLALVPQPLGAVDQLAGPRAHGAHEGLHARPTGLLAAAADRYQHRGAPEGPLADVHPPHRHQHPHLRLVQIRPHARRQPDPGPDGRG